MTEPIPTDVATALAHVGLPPVVFHREVASTNDVAMELAANGAVEFTAVLADVQRAGRGRRGRDWSSPAGVGVYLSAIIRPHDLEARVGLLTLAAGVAVAQTAVETTGVAVELKWPNDVVVGRPWRKVAGILCEASGLGTAGAAVVIGMGVNLRRAVYPPDVAVRATSLEAESGTIVERGVFVAACLRNLREQVSRLRAGDTAGVLNHWRSFGAAGLDHAPVRWMDEHGARQGMASGIGEDGALLVEADGTQERLVAGDVVWETLSRV